MMVSVDKGDGSRRFIPCGADCHHDQFPSARVAAHYEFQAVSLLEGMVPMPLKKMGVRPFEKSVRWPSAAVLVDQRPNPFLIVDSPRDQNLQIVRKRNQSSIEHPVCRAGKRKPVADNVRAVLLDRSDMSGIDFGAPIAVYQPQPRYRTSLAVCPKNRPSEDPVPYDARG